MKRLLFALSLVLLVTACSQVPSTPEEGPNGSDLNDSENASVDPSEPSDVTLPRYENGELNLAAIREAEDASQCVKTTLGPCPCESGGEPVAVNERYVGLLEEQRNTSQGVACTQVYQCTSVEPSVVDGRCVLQAGGSAVNQS